MFNRIYETLSRRGSWTSLASMAEQPEGNGKDMPQGEAVDLPNELILHILDFIPRDEHTQKTLHSCCLVSWQWYNAAVTRLYEHPRITGRNYEKFVNTIAPSVNLHIKKSDLANLVHELDLSRLIHHSTKSMTARLLGRTKENLRAFTAPQASFAVNCFAALSKCSHLHTLDLSLISESITMHNLSHTLQSLRHLQHLGFPRSSSPADHDYNSRHFHWPSSLTNLSLSGSVNDNFLEGLSATRPFNVPPNLKSLTVQHCPNVHKHPLGSFLAAVGYTITSLRVHYMRAIKRGDLDAIFFQCRRLHTLHLSIDHVSDNWPFHASVYDETLVPKSEIPAMAHPLRYLNIISEGQFSREDAPTPLEVLLAVQEGMLPRLRVIRFQDDVGWQTPEHAEEVGALNEVMKEAAAREDGLDEQERARVGIYHYQTAVPKTHWRS